MRAAALVIGLIAAPAMAAEQFDLICTGDTQPWRYRVDLVKNEWCANACSPVFKIVRSSSGTLIFQEPDAGQTWGDKVTTRVNLITGYWYFYRALPGAGIQKTVEGKCALAPYSRIPIIRF